MLQAIPGSQNFKVIGLGKDGKWQCYIVKWGYYKSLWTEKENPIRSIDISQDSIKQVYRIFVDNEIFSMKNKEQIREACKGVSGSAGGRSYEIILFSENACKIIEYHEPELYKHKCPGYAEWQNLINLTKLLFPDKRY